jgi:hypothetical protein
MCPANLLDLEEKNPMNWGAIIFIIGIVALVFVLMFYSGMFMHGDPLEPPPSTSMGAGGS